VSIVCKRVTYAGRVQGVGFRYTAEAVAAHFAVAGYVRNLRSGDVELVAEGEAAEVQAFLDELARVRAANIARTTVGAEPPAGYTDFRIRSDYLLSRPASGERAVEGADFQSKDTLQLQPSPSGGEGLNGRLTAQSIMNQPIPVRLWSAAGVAWPRSRGGGVQPRGIRTAAATFPTRHRIPPPSSSSRCRRGVVWLAALIGVVVVGDQRPAALGIVQDAGTLENLPAVRARCFTCSSALISSSSSSVDCCWSGPGGGGGSWLRSARTATADLLAHGPLRVGLYGVLAVHPVLHVAARTTRWSGSWPTTSSARGGAVRLPDGVASIAEEIEATHRVTLMSKPVSRRQFLLGKFFGIFLAAVFCDRAARLGFVH
jgi:acylphosphatase